MAEGEHLRLRISTAHERVVLRYGAVIHQSQNLALLGLDVLRGTAAGRHIDVVGTVKGDARHTASPVVGYEDVLHVDDRLAIPRAAGERHGAAPFVERLRVGEIDVLVLRELGVEYHVHVAVDGAGQAGDPREVPLRQPGHRLRIEHAVADDADLAFTRRDQHDVVGQEREAERIPETGGDGGHLDPHPFAGVELDRQFGQRLAGKTGGGHRNAVLKGDFLLTCGETGSRDADEQSNGDHALHGGSSWKPREYTRQPRAGRGAF